MINEALSCIATDLNQYLKGNFGIPEEKAIVSAVTDREGSIPIKIMDKVCVTLVNIEQERATRNQKPERNAGSTQAQVNPAFQLNLYVMFSAFFNEYTEALKFISGTAGFLQGKNVFTPQNTPSMSRSLDKLVVELCKINYQEMNYLWGMLGSSYTPSLLCKVWLITVQDNQWISRTPVITETNKQVE